MAVPTLPDRRRQSKAKTAMEISGAAIPSGLLIFVLQGQGSMQSLIESQGQMIATLQESIVSYQHQTNERDANTSTWQNSFRGRISTIEALAQSMVSERHTFMTEIRELDKRLRPLEANTHQRSEK